MTDPESDQLLKIGDLAKQAGVTTRTVRFYEDCGLIEPAGRSQGGFRLYGTCQLDRLKAVLALKKVGFSLDHIREVREVAKEGNVALQVTTRLRECAEEGATLLREKIVRMQETLTDLERCTELLSPCEGCDGKQFDNDCRCCWDDRSGGQIPSFLRVVDR